MDQCPFAPTKVPADVVVCQSGVARLAAGDHTRLELQQQLGDVIHHPSVGATDARPQRSRASLWTSRSWKDDVAD
jgi:hypothetical protein